MLSYLHMGRGTTRVKREGAQKRGAREYGGRDRGGN